eukprot:8064922-Prorocentrum_lima.AAC.1
MSLWVSAGLSSCPFLPEKAKGFLCYPTSPSHDNLHASKELMAVFWRSLGQLLQEGRTIVDFPSNEPVQGLGEVRKRT